MSDPDGSIPATTDERRPHSTLVARHHVQLALTSGFDIDEVLWMLDLAEPLPSAKVHREEVASTQSE